ncbi:hypothetical protein OSB04_023589, partial [Centaurea solstitialis]
METRYVEAKEDNKMLLLMAKADFQSVIWFLDSGFGNHMTGNKKLFLNLDETFRASIMEVLHEVLIGVFTRTSTVRHRFLSSHRFLLEPGCLNKNP